MSGSLVLAAAIAASQALHIQATPPAPPPAATLQVLSPGSSVFTWSPQYDVGQSVALCISSPSGRYDLAVQTSLPALPKGATPINLVVRFSDGSGDQSRPAQPGQRLLFTGQVRPDLKCAGQTTATLTVSLDKDSVIAGIAGDYAFGLDLSLTPR